MSLKKCPFSCCVILSVETLPPRRSKWGSSLPPDCFVSRGSISPCGYFLTIFFSRGGVVSTSPNPQAGGPPLVGFPRLLIQFIHTYPPHRRTFHYPQPEDAPYRSDRDPLHTVLFYIQRIKLLSVTNISIINTERHCCFPTTTIVMGANNNVTLHVLCPCIVTFKFYLKN